MVGRILDWRLLVSLAAVLLAAALVLSVMDTSDTNEERGQRIDDLITEIQHQRETAAGERRAAALERKELLAGQEDLRRKYERLLDRQAALVRWLQRNGIRVPVEFTASSSTTKSGSTSSTPRAPDLPGNSERRNKKGPKK